MDLFRTRPFEVVISALLLPGLSGYDLCRRLKADPVTRPVPVILLTSRTDPADIGRGLEGGAYHLVTKPFRPEPLLARLRPILANQALRRAGASQTGVAVFFLDQKFPLTATHQQVLDLLLATSEDAVSTSRELQASQAELAAQATIEADARLLESRIRTSEEKDRSLLEQADDAVCLLDLQGTVREVNRRGAAMLGRPWTEIIGRLGTDGSARLDKAHLRRADDRRVDGDLSAALVDLGDRRVVLASARCHGSQPAGRPLRQAQKLEAIGRLAGDVAHDFNNLLTVIAGCSDLLLRSPPPDPAAVGLLEDIKQAGEQAATLTRQLLAFSRPQVSKPRVLDLNAAVADVAQMLRRLLGGDVDLAGVLERTPALVRVDPGQVTHERLNLTVNVRDAMPQGGPLTIATTHVILDEEAVRTRPRTRPGPDVLLTGSDTGSGLDEATPARLFEPFFTTKGPEQGTGLGLATVDGLVQPSGGHLAFSSEPGRGTAFQVSLPCVEAAGCPRQPIEAGVAVSISRAPHSAVTVDLAPGCFPPAKGTRGDQGGGILVGMGRPTGVASPKASLPFPRFAWPASG